MAPCTPWHRSPASLNSKGRLMPSAPGLQCPRGERSLPEPCVQAAPHHISLFSSSLPGLSSRYLELNPRETQPPTEANVRASLMAAELALHPSTASWPQLREMLLQGTHEHPQSTTHLPEPTTVWKRTNMLFQAPSRLTGCPNPHCCTNIQKPPKTDTAAWQTTSPSMTTAYQSNWGPNMDKPVPWTNCRGEEEDKELTAFKLNADFSCSNPPVPYSHNTKLHSHNPAPLSSKAEGAWSS